MNDLNSPKLLYIPEHCSTLENVLYAFHRIYILLLLSVLFYKYQLNQSICFIQVFYNLSMRDS